MVECISCYALSHWASYSLSKWFGFKGFEWKGQLMLGNPSDVKMGRSCVSEHVSWVQGSAGMFKPTTWRHCSKNWWRIMSFFPKAEGGWTGWENGAELTCVFEIVVSHPKKFTRSWYVKLSLLCWNSRSSCMKLSIVAASSSSNRNWSLGKSWCMHR